MQCKMILVVLLLLGHGLGGNSYGGKDGARTYSDLYKQWEADFGALRAEGSAEDDEELKDRMIDLRAKYTERFARLATEHSHGDGWTSSLAWISLNGAAGPGFDAMADLMRNRVHSLENTTHIERLMPELIGFESGRLTAALADIARKHSSERVRGIALYCLGARVKWVAERDGSQKGCEQAELLLVKARDDYGDVTMSRRKIREYAEELLSGLRGPSAVGRQAQETKGRDINDEVFDLAYERGKVVVLSFSGHWCYHCRQMHRVEKELLGKYGQKRAVIIEINSDRREDLEGVSEKIEAEGLRWRYVIDGPEGPISKTWQVSAWPTFFVLDREGRIRRRAVGDVGRKLIEWVDRLADE